jgi:hypothetical protein
MNTKQPYNLERFKDGDTFNEKESYQTPLIFTDKERESLLDGYQEVMDWARQAIQNKD